MSDAFGEKLRKRRLERGLTLEALAEQVGSTKAYIWQLENKRPARPSGDLLLKLARTLEVSPDFLIDDSAASPTNKHSIDALARGLAGRGFASSDLDKLLTIADMIKDGRPPKRGK